MKIENNLHNFKKEEKIIIKENLEEIKIIFGEINKNEKRKTITENFEKIMFKNKSNLKEQINAINFVTEKLISGNIDTKQDKISEKSKSEEKKKKLAYRKSKFKDGEYLIDNEGKKILKLTTTMGQRTKSVNKISKDIMSKPITDKKLDKLQRKMKRYSRLSSNNLMNGFNNNKSSRSFRKSVNSRNKKSFYENYKNLDHEVIGIEKDEDLLKTYELSQKRVFQRIAKSKKNVHFRIGSHVKDNSNTLESGTYYKISDDNDEMSEIKNNIKSNTFKSEKQDINNNDEDVNLEIYNNKSKNSKSEKKEVDISNDELNFEIKIIKSDNIIQKEDSDLEDKNNDNKSIELLNEEKSIRKKVGFSKKIIDKKENKKNAKLSFSKKNVSKHSKKENENDFSEKYRKNSLYLKKKLQKNNNLILNENKIEEKPKTHSYKKKSAIIKELNELKKKITIPNKNIKKSSEKFFSVKSNKKNTILLIDENNDKKNLIENSKNIDIEKIKNNDKENSKNLHIKEIENIDYKENSKNKEIEEIENNDYKENKGMIENIDENENIENLNYRVDENNNISENNSELSQVKISEKNSSNFFKNKSIEKEISFNEKKVNFEENSFLSDIKSKKSKILSHFQPYLKNLQKEEIQEFNKILLNFEKNDLIEEIIFSSIPDKDKFISLLKASYDLSRFSVELEKSRNKLQNSKYFQNNITNLKTKNKQIDLEEHKYCYSFFCKIHNNKFCPKSYGENYYKDINPEIFDKSQNISNHNIKNLTKRLTKKKTDIEMQNRKKMESITIKIKKNKNLLKENEDYQSIENQEILIINHFNSEDNDYKIKDKSNNSDFKVIEDSDVFVIKNMSENKNSFEFDQNNKLKSSYRKNRPNFSDSNQINSDNINYNKNIKSNIEKNKRISNKEVYNKNIKSNIEINRRNSNKMKDDNKNIKSNIKINTRNENIKSNIEKNKRISNKEVYNKNIKSNIEINKRNSNHPIFIKNIKSNKLGSNLSISDKKISNRNTNNIFDSEKSIKNSNLSYSEKNSKNNNISDFEKNINAKNISNFDKNKIKSDSDNNNIKSNRIVSIKSLIKVNSNRNTPLLILKNDEVDSKIDKHRNSRLSLLKNEKIKKEFEMDIVLSEDEIE